jgi:hypothetical protein
MTPYRVVLLALIAACRAPGPPPVVQVLPDVRPPPPLEPPTRSTRAAGDTYAAMRHVRFRLDPLLALEIVHLTGRMRPTRSGHPIDFDDPRSLALAIADAEVRIDTTSLARLMNRYVFGFPHAPLTDLHFASRISGRDSLLQVRGVLHEHLAVPFTITASVRMTPGRLIRLHPTDVNLGAVEVDWIMRVLGLHLQQLIDAKQAVGLRLDGNDLIVDPTRALPPPKITGVLREVHVVTAGLALRFHDAAVLARLAPRPRPPVPTSNYMYFRGGVLEFGKLFMPRADMEVVDSAAGDWFDFFLAQYQRQLVAGHSETLPDYGLRVVMQDYDRIVAARRQTAQ